MSLPNPSPDSVVLVTGASAGIGTELARGLAALGHNLVITARDEERLRGLAEQLRVAHGVEVHVLPADLEDDASRDRLIADVRALGKQVVGLCNNAGMGNFGNFTNVDLAREYATVRLNVVAMHHLAGEFAREMVQRGGGAICNLSSVAAFQPIPGNATYAATKAFVQSFSEALHAELGGTGVSVTAVSPGPVKTEFGRRANAGDLESKVPGFAWETAENVARLAIEGMREGKRTVIPGAVSKSLAVGGRFVPRSVLLPAARKVTGSRAVDND